MKKLFLTLVATVATMVAFSQSTTYVNGYTKSNGTYVNGYTKTTNNNTNHDNYSTSGNTNPFTGTTGTKPKDYTYEATQYSSDKTVQTGSNGGQYYINSNGNKTYVPKK